MSSYVERINEALDRNSDEIPIFGALIAAHIAAEADAEIADLRARCDVLEAAQEPLADAALEAKAERDALKADAERYRWLRDALYADDVDVGEAYVSMTLVGSCPSEEQFDAAIDEAMKEST
jgi:hypothetical protein